MAAQDIQRIDALEKRIEALEKTSIPVLQSKVDRHDFPKMLTSPLVCDVIEIPWHYECLEHSFGIIRAHTLIMNVNNLETPHGLHNNHVSRLVIRFHGLSDKDVKTAGQIMQHVLHHCPNVKEVEFSGIAHPRDLMHFFEKIPSCLFVRVGTYDPQWENASVVLNNLRMKSP